MAVPFDPSLVTLIRRVLSVGNLKRVLQRYAQKGGAHAAALAPYIATLGTGPSRPDDSKVNSIT